MLGVTAHRAKDGWNSFVDPSDGVALAYGHSASFGQLPESPAWYEDEGLIAAVHGDIYDSAFHLRASSRSFQNQQVAAVVASYERDAEKFPAGIDGVFSLFLWDR